MAHDPGVARWLAFWREREEKFAAAQESLRASVEPGVEASLGLMDAIFEPTGRRAIDPAADALASEKLIGTWAWQNDANARLTFAEDGTVRGAWVMRDVGGELGYGRSSDVAGRWRVRGGV